MALYTPSPDEVLESVEAKVAPVVFDSPHSGTWYPPDFGFACDAHRLRWAGDTFVDELWAGTRAAGCGFLRALFPRSYIDPNRAIDDIDEGLFASPWPLEVNPSEKARAGMGLIRRLSLPDEPIYDRMLTVSEGLHRITHYYQPYHDALDALVSSAHERWGVVWHINCHSMKQYGNAMNTDPGRRRADFVLGDREGTTCGLELRELVHGFLVDKGYSVAINDPYKGLELVRRHGQPDKGRHSLQVEINRALFLDEEPMIKTSGFDHLKANLSELVGVLAKTALTRAYPVNTVS